jgi:hypothetical protein
LESLFVSSDDGKDCMQLYPANVEQKFKLCLVWLLGSLIVIAFFVRPLIFRTGDTFTFLIVILI